MKRKRFSYIFISVILFIVTISSCQDNWDEHYSSNIQGVKSKLNLYEYIKTQSDLSIFTQMLHIAGYDSILSKPQTYTIWAPVNSALQNINLKDTITVIEIVKNHIARFSYPTSGIKSKTVFMLDKKILTFANTGSSYTFGGVPLLKANTATANGILHSINGYVPYLRNIWEFIGNAKGLDSLRAYLYSQNNYKFDANASIEIGTNANGQSVYDSVITFTNNVLDRIGHIHIEDSTFIAILPTNIAWVNAYNKVKNGYKTRDIDGGAATQRLYAQYALVQNLVFKKNNIDPLTLINPTDSLISTTGSIYHQPYYLFEGATKTILSNGFAFTTDSLRYKASESWQQPIRIEAENSGFGRSNSISTIYVRSSLGTTFNLSNDKYLIVEPTSIATDDSVTFPIPNTLSGKYNIYCVFVSSSIVSPTDTRRTKVKFYLSYMDNTGKQIKDARINSSHLVLTDPNKISSIFTTDFGPISKMFVTQFEFPYCNILTKDSKISDISVKLKVENAVKINETTIYDRTMRIDYIVFEPVQ